MASSSALASALAYRADLKDAIDGCKVNALTSLVALHKPDLSTNAGRLLENLSNQARPAKLCQLLTEDGHAFPPDQMLQDLHILPKYRLLVTFNRLLTSPVLRLICEWDNSVQAASGAATHTQVLLDFHFNQTDSGVPGIQDFEIYPDLWRSGSVADEICFIASGATSEGLPNLALLENSIGEHGRSVLENLRALLKPQNPVQIRLRFFEPLDATNSAMATILPYVTGAGKLPSLSMPEYSMLPLQPKRDMEELLYAPSPLPWVPHKSGKTYATVTEACVELYESARLSQLEADEILRQWASIPHLGTLYKIGNTVVMAVRSSPGRPLGGPGGVTRFEPPDRLQTQMEWTDEQGKRYTAIGNKCVVPVRLPTAYDILLVLPNTDGRLQAVAVAPLEFHVASSFMVTFTPSYSHMVLETQLQTAVNLQHPDASKWHQIILNQDHDLPIVDLATKRVDGEVAQELEEAYRWMLNWQSWNNEQLQALKSIRAAIGGIVLITGPAGTGKTLVLQAICVFLYRLGLHVLVLAPANSNCTDFMRRLVQYFPDVPATRVFPPSMDHKMEKLVREQNQHANCAGNNDGKGDLPDFEVVRSILQSATEKYAFQDYGLQAQVLTAAREEGKYTLVQRINGEDIDVWQRLRMHILESDTGTLKWTDAPSLKSYQLCYDACKAHFIAMARIVVTTTGNVRMSDVVDNWARDKHIPCKGLVVILDEACKDRECDSLSALLVPEWREKITGMIMLGDERQLEPTNTSASGRISFNPFRDRLSMPFLTRLKSEGFPCVELVEQHRMAASISAWPSKNFYPCGLRNGHGTHGLLKEKLPGLHEILKSILKSVRKMPDSPLLDYDKDTILRTQYIQIRGTRDRSKRSPVVREHVRFFFDKIYWPLKAYFGEAMEENVMVICAYKEAKHCWQEAATHIGRQHKIPPAQMPRILTIDSSQGCEALVTLIDCSVQEYDERRRYRDVGFVDDDKRINVAWTRAKEVRIVLGGSCSVEKAKEKPKSSTTPAYVRFREEIAIGTDQQVTIVKNKGLRVGDMSWLDHLRKPEVTVRTRYADDIARAAERGEE